ncbi:dynein regulatory complex protein 10-like [Leptopilina heterotoma]|uniref:dynein regulatory complex protein 10-like n=1 Tax=Leptopilina heterotoma TaxID=63436 RepID=UPI001CA863DA|nr:dynein regulatory complex protein 10-like [Leptopilina heterotoma]
MFEEQNHEEAILRLMRILKDFSLKIEIAMCLSEIYKEEKFMRILKPSEQQLFENIYDSYTFLQKHGEREIFQEGCISVDSKLTLLLEVLSHYPRIGKLTKKFLENAPTRIKNLIKCVNIFNDIVEERIRTTPSEERKYKLKLRNASAVLEKAKIELEPLKITLDEQRNKHLEFVKGISEEIDKCEKLIEQTQTEHKRSITKIVNDSESVMVSTYLEMREKQETIKNQIEIHEEEYKKLLDECASREKILHEAHLKSQKQLMSSLINYDANIKALHLSKVELSSNLNKLIMEFKDLQDAYNVQATSYAILKQEKEEALMKAFAEKMENFSSNRAAKIIQRTWREYRIRMASKRKKKLKKNKTPRR